MKVHIVRLPKNQRFSTSFKLFLVALLCGLAAFCVFPFQVAGGVACGLFAFSCSVIALQKVTSRVLSVGSVGGGVKNAMFWTAFKFLAPMSIIFYAIWRSFSPAAVVFGMMLALGSFSAMLWLGGKR